MLKISSDCQCSFYKRNLLNSSVDCKADNELTYTATLEFSTDSGSETASIIAERITRQIPFSMLVGGTQLTVTDACTDCETSTIASSLSPAVGSGLFVGGFAAAILITAMLVTIVYVDIRFKVYTYSCDKLKHIISKSNLQDSSKEKLCKV